MRKEDEDGGWFEVGRGWVKGGFLGGDAMRDAPNEREERERR